MQWTDFASWIEDNHFHIRQTVESMSHCRSGITGGRGQNGHWLIARNMGQHLCHKATAEIFKCQRWPVEQFQTTDIAFNIGDRSREGKRRAHALFQDFLRDFITNKRREDLRTAGDKIQLQHLINFSQAEFRQVMRKKQPLIFAQPLGYGLRKADLLVVIFQIVEFHLVFQYSCARRIQPANMNKTFLILQVVLTQPVGNALGGIRLVT
ncbi:Uncharacterised protein [Shigella sonnei]|nr:Uncharacterised protein [Shigella sonnei]